MATHPQEGDSGVRLILQEIRGIQGEIRDIKGEIRDIQGEMRDLRRESAEDRKQWAEDRKQAAEDRKEAHQDRRDIRDALVVIGNVGRRIIQTQEKHTKLLTEIRDILKVRGDGHSPRTGGNGPSK